MEHLRETSKHTSLKKVKAFPNFQVISNIEEKDVGIQACELDESICNNEFDNVESRFCFFMISFLLSSIFVFP